MRAATLALAALLAGCGSTAVTTGDPALLSTDTAAVCTRGWATAHRDVSEATYRAALQVAGIPYEQRHQYEYDHRVPLELGGSNDVSNLWLQPWLEARQKDRAEDHAHEVVCSGHATLSAAQHDFEAGAWQRWLP